NIEDSLDAAFIEFGEEKQGFLPFAEVRPEIFPEECKNKKNLKISDVLYRGQEIVIQVTKDEIGNKGAALSTYLSLPGRYVVLMHSDESGGGISRKIDSEAARQAAREMLSKLNVPEGMAVIIRTAGITAAKKELYRDFTTLCEAWQQINKGAQLGRAPTLLYREPDIVIKTIRDYFSSEVNKIHIDDAEEYEDALRYFTENMPDLVKKLELHKKKEPIFHHFGIEQAIEELFKREVKLPSGGYIVIEQTEALVSVDVNSGKSTKEEGHANTVYKTNLEATEELARQLRLRDLGGIIIVDFIDMLSSKHRRDVERKLKNVMRTDKARIKIGMISENGILELTRQRLRQSHQLISHVTCNHCAGTGRVRDAAGLAILALRNISGYLAKKRKQLSILNVQLPVEVANFLNNSKRKELLELCNVHETEINVMGDQHFQESAIEFKEERRGQAGLHAASLNKDFKSEILSGKQSFTKNNKQASWNSANKKISPPPSIGPVPTLIDFDENEAETIPTEIKEQIVEIKHYDDVIMEALFGVAPDIDVSDIVKLIQTTANSFEKDKGNDSVGLSDNENIVNETKSSTEVVSTEEPVKKPKRRRFSRSKKNKAIRNPNQPTTNSDAVLPANSEE
ncbi:MAG: Rne/Rng family ribonuclease, partial [bacterium]|nr:Rne/Rng family ribonuclease [bacterium]